MSMSDILTYMYNFYTAFLKTYTSLFLLVNTRKKPCFLFLKCLSCMFILQSAHVWNFDTNNDQLNFYITLTGSFGASIITSVEQFLSWPGPAARAHQHVCRLLPRSLLLSLSPGEISNVNFREN